MSTSDPKLLLVASTGGHLTQLLRLSEAIPHSPDSVWVTFRTPQSESLLAGRRTHYVPYVRPRDLRGVIRASRIVSKLLRREHFDGAVSTGAGLALAALPQAKRRGLSCLYIESVSRVDGPSLTGRVIEFTRSADLATQHRSWNRKRWSVRPSVFGQYTVRQKPAVLSPTLLVTLGTIRGYAFHAAVDAVLRTGLADDRTVWQLGETSVQNLPGSVVDQLSMSEFSRAAAQADVVITHAGVGTLLDLFELGKYPLVIPRRRARGEHVDDHQLQIARMVADLGLAHVTDAQALRADDVIEASRHVLEKSVGS